MYILGKEEYLKVHYNDDGGEDSLAHSPYAENLTIA